MSHMTEALNTCEISQSLMFGGISSALQIEMTKLEARAKKNIPNPPFLLCSPKHKHKSSNKRKFPGD